MKKVLVNFLCGFVPSKKVRHNIRNKYLLNANTIVVDDDSIGNTSLPDVDEPKYKFYGQFNPPVDKFIFERYFDDVNFKGTCIECGAYDGVIDSCTKFFEENCDWNCYNIEAVPYIFEKLRDNRPQSKNFNLALFNENGEKVFSFPIHPVYNKDFGNGSLRHTESHRQQLLEENCKFEEFTIQTLTYKEFISKNNIKSVDLFVLDVEGVELEVIEGMSGCDVLPTVMCVEYPNAGLEKIRTSLEKLGYVFDTTSNVNAFFIKKDMVNLLIFKSLRKI